MTPLPNTKPISFLLCVVGLPILIGGVCLAALGGSLYYTFAGVALVVSGVLLYHGNRNGGWIYGLFFATTIAWIYLEVGFDFWSSIPRLGLPVVLGIGVSLKMHRTSSSRNQSRSKAAHSIIIASLLSLIGFGVLAFAPRHSAYTKTASTIFGDSVLAEDTEWRHYGRTTTGTRFSPANQITPNNVTNLNVAWIYRMGDPQHPSGEHQVTPLQVGDKLYLCTDRNEVIALDVDSGKERWRFNPKVTPTTYRRCRGVGYYEAHGTAEWASENCRRRIIVSTIDARLFALDADTGKPCKDFGAGFVDLKLGMGEVRHDYYFQTSAPLIAGDLIVVGGLVRDGVNVRMPSGAIRAFRATTGEMVWAWDAGMSTIDNRPAQERTYARGSPNMWSTASYDKELGLIYAPLGVATGATDFWGGWRNEEMEYFGNSVVALEADTGRLRWHFQALHHDLWDYDLPPQPTLFDIPDGRGGKIPALIQGSKHGQIFLLDRRDGKPITPIIEKPVPQSRQPDDWTSPTQPYSVGMPDIGAGPLTESNMWGVTPFDHLWCRLKFKRLRYDGQFTPPTVAEPALMYPSLLGGMNWGGVTVDEERGYLLVNDIRLAMEFQLLPRAEYNKLMQQRQSNGVQWPSPLLPPEQPYGTAAKMMLSPFGIPCNAPPWGTMTAIDLASRKIVWQKPLGTTRDVIGLPFPIGMPTLGGSIVTKSGLVFFAGSSDFYLRAIHVTTGEELWKGRLPVGAQATPMTYVSPRTKRQFVVIVAGGAAKSVLKGDYVIAFSLSEKGSDVTATSPAL